MKKYVNSFNCVNLLYHSKSFWKLYPNFLRQYFWKEHTFWSDGYFVCSIGDANPDTIRRYIQNQG